MLDPVAEQHTAIAILKAEADRISAERRAAAPQIDSFIALYADDPDSVVRVGPGPDRPVVHGVG